MYIQYRRYWTKKTILYIYTFPESGIYYIGKHSISDILTTIWMKLCSFNTSMSLFSVRTSWCVHLFHHWTFTSDGSDGRVEWAREASFPNCPIYWAAIQKLSNIGIREGNVSCIIWSRSANPVFWMDNCYIVDELYLYAYTLPVESIIKDMPYKTDLPRTTVCGLVPLYGVMELCHNWIR